MSGIRLDRDSDMLLEESAVISGARPGAAEHPAQAVQRADSAPALQTQQRRVSDQMTPPQPHHHHSQQQQQQQQPPRSSSGRSRTPLRRQSSSGVSTAAAANACTTAYTTPTAGGGGSVLRTTPVTAAKLRGIAGGAAAVVVNKTPPGRLSILNDQPCTDQRWAHADQSRRCGATATAVQHAKHGNSAVGSTEGGSTNPSPLPPAKWSGEDVRRWVCEVAGGQFRAAAAALPPSVDGKAFTRFPEARFKQLFGVDDAAARRGKALYEHFRDEVRSHSAQRMQAAREVAGECSVDTSSGMGGRRRSAGAWMVRS